MKEIVTSLQRRAERERHLVDEVAAYVDLHRSLPGWDDVGGRRDLTAIVQGARTVREAIGRVTTEVGGGR